MTDLQPADAETGVFIYDDVRPEPEGGTGEKGLRLDGVQALLPGLTVAAGFPDLEAFGFVRRRPDPPTPEQLATARAASAERICRLIDSERDRRQQLDFPWDFGATPALDDMGQEAPAGVRSLQMGLRNQSDWQGLHAFALAAVVGGQPERLLPMRCDDNVNVQTEAVQVLTVLQAAALRNSRLVFIGGALKTQVRMSADPQMPPPEAWDA